MQIIFASNSIYFISGIKGQKHKRLECERKKIILQSVQIPVQRFRFNHSRNFPPIQGNEDKNFSFFLDRSKDKPWQRI